MERTPPLPIDIDDVLERLGRSEKTVNLLRRIGTLSTAMLYELEPDAVERYRNSKWSLDDLRQFNQTAKINPEAGVGQVFRHWHRLTVLEYGLEPKSYEEAKVGEHDLSLLGTFVIYQAIPGEVSAKLLGEYHSERIGRLINKA